MSTLNSRLQLALINRKKNRNLIEKGFTLVELMIVIVIVGVLSAVAVPQFLGVRDKASAGAEIGEFVGLAKECSSAIIIDGPYPADYDDTIVGATPGVSRDCNDGSGGGPTANVVFTGTTLPVGSELTLNCGPSEAAADKVVAGKACAITVNFNNGAMTFAPV